MTLLYEMHQDLVNAGFEEWVSVVPVFSYPNLEDRHIAMVATGGAKIYAFFSHDILNVCSTEARRLRALAQLEMLLSYPGESYTEFLVRCATRYPCRRTLNSLSDFRQINDIIAADTENKHGWRIVNTRLSSYMRESH